MEILPFNMLCKSLLDAIEVVKVLEKSGCKRETGKLSPNDLCIVVYPGKTFDILNSTQGLSGYLGGEEIEFSHFMEKYGSRR